MITQKHFEQIAERTTPLTPVRVSYNPNLFFHKLYEDAIAALKDAGFEEIANQLRHEAQNVNYDLKMATVVAQYVSLDLDWGVPAKQDDYDDRRQEREGREEIMRELATHIFESTPCIESCIVDDFNQERTDFSLIAHMELPVSVSEQKGYPMRQVTFSMRKTLRDSEVDGFDVISPKRIYKTSYGSKYFEGYERRYIQIEATLHPK